MSASLPLTRTSPQDLEIVASERDLLYDLIIYMDYMRTHSVRRMVRSNEIPKADLQRVARLLGDAEIEQALKQTGRAIWIDYLDQLAYRMGLVSYDTEGEYVGYSSNSPTFRENYILVNEKAYLKYLNAAPSHQAKRILNALTGEKNRPEYDSRTEFHRKNVLGRLDPFDTRGIAIGIFPTLDFKAIRQFLLDLLTGCDAGVWYSTASLIGYLKTYHPYFLIPEKIPLDRWGQQSQRYDNFYDGKERWAGKPISADDPDAFERVEGRYVERFLEGLPLEMGLIEVAYSLQPYEGKYPSYGQLAAFRVNERFLHLMSGQIEPPVVRVLPNFDVMVESELYPAGLMQQVERLAERAPGMGGAYATVTTLVLKKERVAAELVRRPDLDVAAMLRSLTGRELPPNIATELAGWSGHADQFVLYTGFGLLESASLHPQAQEYIAETITPELSLVRKPDDLLISLENSALVPLQIRHLDELTLLPETVQSRFPHQQPAAPEPNGPEALQIQRFTLVSLKIPLTDAFEEIRKALAEARCPIQADPDERIIQYAQQHQPIVDQVLAQLSPRYLIEIEDRA